VIVRPSIRSLMVSGYLQFGGAMVALLVMLTVIDLLSGEPVRALQMDLSVWAFFVLMPLSLGILYVVQTVPFGVHIARDGIRGRGRWARRVFLRWREIDDVRLGDNGGLYVGNAKSKARVTMFLGGADLQRIHAELVRCAGAEHLLTQCFDVSALPAPVVDPKAWRLTRWQRRFVLALAGLGLVVSGSASLYYFVMALYGIDLARSLLLLVPSAAACAATLWCVFRGVAARAP